MGEYAKPEELFKSDYAYFLALHQVGVIMQIISLKNA